ncbi:MAG TPA: class I SAM-dependent methyltransferase [Amycolatopsis sp.]|nr:class I SAM-dependent methyltransferase [Amycolatopsis sp.]
MRQIAESFGVDAARYDRARPPYPAELIGRLADAGRDVLDVGCGTGIAARQLRERGCAVLGVEPDERMAEFASAKGIEVEVARFEQWDANGRTFDAVVSGQAWHWVDPVEGARQAAQVLRPGGVLGLFWHVFAPPEDIAAAFGEAFRKAVPEFPIKADRVPSRDAYRPVVEKSLAGSEFGALEQRFYEWQHHYTRDEYLDLLPTQGGLTRLSDEQRATVLTAVGAAIDARGGRFTCDYTTVLFTAAKR